MRRRKYGTIRRVQDFIEGSCMRIIYKWGGYLGSSISPCPHDNLRDVGAFYCLVAHKSRKAKRSNRVGCTGCKFGLLCLSEHDGSYYRGFPKKVRKSRSALVVACCSKCMDIKYVL